MYQVWFQAPGEAAAFLAKDPNHSLQSGGAPGLPVGS